MARKILIVEDSPAEMNLIRSALEHKGYDIFTASDGEEALETAATVQPDLVLLDIVLPKKNGFQVCRHLKTSPATNQAKIILVSSKNQESDRFWGMKQGADEYLTKPFDEAQLLSSVKRHL